MYRERSFLIFYRITLFVYAAFIVVVHPAEYRFTRPLVEKVSETTPTYRYPAEKRDIADYPYLAALLYTNSTIKIKKRLDTYLDLLCSGTIISQDYVLTAASCLVGRNPNRTFVSAGSNNYRYHDKKTQAPDVFIHVIEFYTHPEFGLLMDRDLAIIRLRQKLPLLPRVQPVKLPPKNRPLEAMSMVVLSGWGKYRVNRYLIDINVYRIFPHVMVVDVPVINHHDCWDDYNKELGIFTDVLWCSENYQMGIDDESNDDHGAPAVQHSMLVGVLSGKPGKTFRKRAMYPVFTNIASTPIRNFIKSRTKL